MLYNGSPLISAGKQQAPHCLLVVIQLAIDNLLVYLCCNAFSPQQSLKSSFQVLAAFPD
jgi:hypothetical protein